LGTHVVEVSKTKGIVFKVVDITVKRWKGHVAEIIVLQHPILVAIFWMARTSGELFIPGELRMRILKRNILLSILVTLVMVFMGVVTLIVSVWFCWYFQYAKRDRYHILFNTFMPFGQRQHTLSSVSLLMF